MKFSVPVLALACILGVDFQTLAQAQNQTVNGAQFGYTQGYPWSQAYGFGLAQARTSCTTPTGPCNQNLNACRRAYTRTLTPAAAYVGNPYNWPSSNAPNQRIVFCRLYSRLNSLTELNRFDPVSGQGSYDDGFCRASSTVTAEQAALSLYWIRKFVQGTNSMLPRSEKCR